MPSHRLILTVVLSIIVFALIVFYFHKSTYPSKVFINDAVFYVEVADTKELLEKGLSGHAPLGEAEGMFFIFKTPEKYGFWMKDMLFSIDIIWIDANSRISYIESAVTPETYPKVFAPDAPALYTLEVKSGTAERLGFKIGDAVKIAK